MGRNFKFTHYAFAPIDRSHLLNVIDSLEKSIDANNPRGTISITVSGAKNTTVHISSEHLAELVEIMKFALNED